MNKQKMRKLSLICMIAGAALLVLGIIFCIVVGIVLARINSTMGALSALTMGYGGSMKVNAAMLSNILSGKAYGGYAGDMMDMLEVSGFAVFMLKMCIALRIPFIVVGILAVAAGVLMHFDIITPKNMETAQKVLVKAASKSKDVAAKGITKGISAASAAVKEGIDKARVRCPKCGKMNAYNASFCSGCGERIPKPVKQYDDYTPAAPALRCDHCGAVFHEDLSFCTECGNKLMPAPPPRRPQEIPAPVFDAPEEPANLEFCPHCGARNDGGLAFCQECGAGLAVSQRPVPNDPPAPRHVPDIVDDVAAGDAEAKQKLIRMLKADPASPYADRLADMAEAGNPECLSAYAAVLRDRDPQRSLRYEQRAAEAGSADSQMVMGFYYMKGNVVPANEERAVYWTGKAAEQGKANAQYNLAIAYLQGKGLQKNIAAALQWLERAAEQRYYAAHDRLIRIYLPSAPEFREYANPARGFHWAKDGAENGGSTECMLILGRCYFQGVGVAKDVETARFWVQKAADGGNEAAKATLERFFK